ncbi:type I restriction enzyme, R subunit [Bathymodiolus platifrons methanotrophic gill symbiont]|uniref:type I restriction endonuclease subunit R n=1 Tax=Bathymodiolus platifrons methanotrophic gill symbiont TaxID=113268 RepID=UPI000B4152B7|nr:type I restriction endonuclease subunit R [Bathymodiolus platifrons methanotrophic gill symbiont]GAW87487.1 type I restriction enzyme, R subunit [Bathymodiolus platifrons methanotrophic gill symbiont]GFO76989.1 type I restriction enzyme, R subunit [Bathymodiolus platifrons methanotrophic gill symbiont]
MTDLTEGAIEQNLIGLLKTQGYEYYNGTELDRNDFASVVLEDQLKASLKRLNPDLPESARVEAFQHVMHLGSNDIMTNNEKFHQMLTDGLTVEYFKQGETVGLQVKLIDFETPENNNFWAVNQFVIKENNQSKRLDVVLFVNGLPLVIIELKSAISEKATLERAYTQIQNYKTAVPSIFYYNALCVISDGVDARTSSVSAPFSRFLAWKSPDKKENGVLPELQILAQRMLQKTVLLRLVRFNTVFESEEVKDEKTGLLSQIKIKKIAAYHQYYVVEKAIHETLRATETEGDRKVGVVWHTQGSGKSLSMVFYSGQLVVEKAMQNPTLVILTDRNDLDDQLFTTFGNCASLLRQKPVQANSRENLKELLQVTGGGIVFTTIQKFYPEEGNNVFGTLSKRSNIVVVADEAHRSQYGFTGKVDKDGNIKYGNAKHLRDALPNASFIGFTGTPIEKEDRDTQKVFGGYIDIYDIAQAVEDGATVPLSYESRLVKIKFNKDANEKIDELIEGIEGATDEQLEKAKKKNARVNAIIGHPERLKDISKDIVTHFESRQAVFEGKGMIVCMTRQIAVDLYEQIKQLKPEWHHDDLDKGVIKVVMTSSSDDPESFQPHHTNKKDRQFLAARLKDSHDKLNLVIVQSMWLTGFDAPPLHTLYIDKRMQGAALMQAIARVNRVYKDKPGGLIVDYIGIGQDLRSAMKDYTESGGQGNVAPDIDEIISAMNAKFEVVKQMFHKFDYEPYFDAPTGEKLKILLAAQNFILKDEKLKDRFLSEVTTLSKLYVMAVPSYGSEVIKDKIAFFKVIKSRINKFTPSGEKTDIQVNTAIRQIVDDALSSDGVVDIFEAAGVNSPSLSILSEEFLLEVKNMEHENLAFELLKKLLNDEVKTRKRKNTIQGKKFSEMLESTIKHYHNNQIDTAQVIKELAGIAEKMNLEDHKADDLDLTPEEYAFYSILSQNSSTEYLEDNKMKELIHLIVDIIRKNATVDWNKRADVKAKLRLLVKKVLIKYGYPPDVARIEADGVLEQSELLASELTS